MKGNGVVFFFSFLAIYLSDYSLSSSRDKRVNNENEIPALMGLTSAFVLNQTSWVIISL